MNTHQDFRITILKTAHALSYHETYKSDLEFQFNGLLKQEEDIQ